jgi:hypothetical protein
MVLDSAGLLSQSKNDGDSPVKERVAVVVAIVEEGPGETFLVIGDGETFERWRLDGDKVRKLVTEGLPIALSRAH